MSFISLFLYLLAGFFLLIFLVFIVYPYVRL
jgi:hypothetical protein